MEKMKKLYEKVAADGALQAKFNAILNDAEKEGQEATEAKLISFAKEAGFEISLDEMRAFFKELSQKEQGQLSEEELDAVAGGMITPYETSVVNPSICDTDPAVT